MATYYFEIYAFGSGLTIDNNGSGTGSDGLVASDGTANAQNNTWGSIQNGGWSVGPDAGSRFQVTGSAEKIGIWVTDDDAFLQDGAGDTGAVQVLAKAVTIGGVTYPAGSRVELEYSIDTEAGGDAADYYVVRLAGNGLTESAGDTGYNVGILATTSDALSVGTTYTVSTSIDGPSLAYANALCFGDGTMIATPSGERSIEKLRPGDLVLTRDRGAMPLLWVGSRHHSWSELVARPDLRPICFDTGSIGNTRPLLLSPQHRLPVADWRAQLWFGADEILVAAKSLIDGTAIRPVVRALGVTYYHLLLESHEMLLADGCWAESFFPGVSARESLLPTQVEEIDRALLAARSQPLAEPRQTALPVQRMRHVPLQASSALR